MFDPSLHILFMLGAAAFAAGFVDSIAGGGGLITIPALLLAGMPPVEALGTNKLQGLFGSGSAMLAYAAGGHVDVRRRSASEAQRACEKIASQSRQASSSAAISSSAASTAPR